MNKEEKVFSLFMKKNREATFLNLLPPKIIDIKVTNF